MYVRNFPGITASLFSSQCLAASTSSFIDATINLHPPTVTVSTLNSSSNAVAFRSPAMPNSRVSLSTQLVYFFSFPPRPLRTPLSRFPNTTRFGNRPPLIRMSASAHKNPLIRNVVSMLSYPVIARARLYEVMRCERDAQRLALYGYITLVKWNIKVLELVSIHVITQGTGLILPFFLEWMIPPFQCSVCGR